MKRGGKAVCQAIDAALSAHRLEDICNHWNWLHEKLQKQGQT